MLVCATKDGYYFLISFQVKVTGPDSTPAINEPVYVFAHCKGPTENLTLTTDNKGMASFSLDTSLWKDRVSLQVGIQTNPSFLPLN